MKFLKPSREILPDFAFDDWPSHYARQVWLSHFPAPLKGDAYIAAPFLFFREAKTKGMLDDFAPIEANFMRFYRELIGDEPVLFSPFRRPQRFHRKL